VREEGKSRGGERKEPVCNSWGQNRGMKVRGEYGGRVISPVPILGV